MRAQEKEATRTEPVPKPRNIKPTNFNGILEGMGRRGDGPRKKKERRREKRPVTQTVHGWICESVTRPLRTVMKA